ncbi:MAG: flagellar motor switch protein FliN [Armatimonadota bacterium]
MPETTGGPEDTPARQPDGESTTSAQGEEPRTPHPEATDGLVHQLRPEPAERQADADDGAGGWRNLHRMLDVPLSLTVELGSTEMPLAEVLRLEGGSVITIDRIPGEPIDLLINGRVFARGEVVVINETFGYRITELVDDAESTLEIARDGG